jgi:hypothetical protein
LMAPGHKLSGLIMHVGFVQKPPNSVAPFLVNPRPSGEKVLLMIFSIGCMFVSTPVACMKIYPSSCFHCSYPPMFISLHHPFRLYSTIVPKPHSPHLSHLRGEPHKAIFEWW